MLFIQWRRRIQRQYEFSRYAEMAQCKRHTYYSVRETLSKFSNGQSTWPWTRITINSLSSIFLFFAFPRFSIQTSTIELIFVPFLVSMYLKLPQFNWNNYSTTRLVRKTRKSLERDRKRWGRPHFGANILENFFSLLYSLRWKIYKIIRV